MIYPRSFDVRDTIKAACRTAMDDARIALQAQAARTVRRIIKERARAYAIRPRELDAIEDKLSLLKPRGLYLALSRLSWSCPRWFGFGGEVHAINLRGALLYARYARAKARQLGTEGGMVEHSPLPWRIDPDDKSAILDCDGNFIVTVVLAELRPSEAALIVRAVNSHDALLAAAMEVMELSIHIDAPRLRAAFIHLQAAIAAVEEQEQ